MPAPDGRLWITGGSFLNSTEFVSPGNAVDGPDLPGPLRFHCLVQMSSTTMILIGGSTEPGNFGQAFAVNTTYFYDIASQTWSDGPELMMVS